MMINNIKVIIFDVDGTLSDDISWLKITECLGADPKIHTQIFDRMKKGELSYPDAKKQLIDLWQKTGNANKLFMKNMFSDWNLKDDSVETIKYLSEKYRICLMSGAVDFYVETVAQKLEIRDWFANTELIWDSKNNLIDFNYFIDQSAKKNRTIQDVY